MAEFFHASPEFKKSAFFVVAAIAAVTIIFMFPSMNKRPSVSLEYVRVMHVVDGDTFKIQGGEKVRILGIDTPEMHESNKLFRDSVRSGQDADIIKEMGRKAKEFVSPLIDGKKVRLEFDIQKRDKYGRLLAYVYLEDGTFINKRIIEQGYASPLTIPPNIKYADEFKSAYKSARSKGLGLWKF